MNRTIRARVKGGVLEPLEKVELPEGEEVTVTIAGESSEEDIAAFRRAAGSWRGKVDAAALMRNIYADRLLSTRPKPNL